MKLYAPMISLCSSCWIRLQIQCVPIFLHNLVGGRREGNMRKLENLRYFLDVKCTFISNYKHKCLWSRQAIEGQGLPTGGYDELQNAAFRTLNYMTLEPRDW